MCRFLLYLGPEIPLADVITRPSHSLIHQSYKSEEREEPLNGDGFGLSWYVPHVGPEPALFRSVSPAWSNQNLAHLARVSRSRCVLAHVRAATPGLPVTETNCHPFVHGPWSFMHNGHVASFRDVRRRMIMGMNDAVYQTIGGTTDSEHLFALYLQELGARAEQEPLEAMAQALEGAIARTVELVQGQGTSDETFLNLAVSDGRRAAISRFITGDAPERANTLYVFTGGHLRCEAGIATVHPESHSGERSALVASEPLTHQPGWRRVPPNTMVLIDEARDVEMRSIGG